MKGMIQIVIGATLVWIGCLAELIYLFSSDLGAIDIPKFGEGSKDIFSLAALVLFIGASFIVIGLVEIYRHYTKNKSLPAESV